MTAPRKYTDEQVEALRVASKADVALLAERWGVPVNTLISKRQEIRSGITRRMREERAALRKRAEVRRYAPRCQFARPSWFEENLTSMSMGRR